MLKNSIKYTLTSCPYSPFKNEEGKPHYHSAGSSGIDLQAWIPEGLILKPQERLLIPTGLSIELPLGLEGQVRSRSGLALKEGLIVLNSPGTIDSDYRGEIKVIVYNTSLQDILIFPGMRIAQLVIAPVVQCHWENVLILDVTPRGIGGFGSTGV